MLWIEIAALTFYLLIIGFLFSGVLQINNPRSRRQSTVSVVVAARNEAANIEACLRALAAQSYSKNLLQIVIVDDRSTDDTLERLRRFRETFAGDMIIKKVEATPAKISPKKFALSQGIESASGEIIFATDADCQPPPEWVAETAPLFSEDVGMVIGPAPFEPARTFWEKLLALDNFAAAFVAAGAAGWNVGATCSGRNLAYRKSVYEEVGGFKAIQHSLSGDDDLFLQQIKKRTRWHIRFSLNPKTVVPSRPAASLAEFIRQRRRHVSAAKYYSKPLQAAYGMFNLANLMLFGFLIYAALEPSRARVAGSFFAAKLVADFGALFLIAKKFGKSNLLFMFPIWEIFFLINQIFVSPLGLMGKIKWK
jgi:cellulose synthase/poly-beta-1,6-N-acetylglucosamine synthase-like glycosyltransferase